MEERKKEVMVVLCLCPGGFICSVCFLVVCSLSALLLIPRVACAS